MSENSRFISSEEAQGPFFVGVDLGGTNIKVGVVDDLGRPLSYLTIPTDDGAKGFPFARDADRNAADESLHFTTVFINQ